jgi:hypothetical protein
MDQPSRGPRCPPPNAHHSPELLVPARPLQEAADPAANRHSAWRPGHDDVAPDAGPPKPRSGPTAAIPAPQPRPVPLRMTPPRRHAHQAGPSCAKVRRRPALPFDEVSRAARLTSGEGRSRLRPCCAGFDRQRLPAAAMAGDDGGGGAAPDG